MCFRSPFCVSELVLLPLMNKNPTRKMTNMDQFNIYCKSGCKGMHFARTSRGAEEQLNTHIIQAGKALLELAFTNEELLQELDEEVLWLKSQNTHTGQVKL
ncbi:Uncharacterized protein Fot_13137 [Forsythia ovata]|uniref:Uncharacterized protein n=1 Tax=Forsythia ovata TaxID=205694 RepID=A0ABD1W2N0_9LAMI